MMKDITLTKKDVFCGNLILVNLDCPIVQDSDKDIVPAVDTHPEIVIKREAASMLKHILADIKSDGNILPVSGFRSKKEQSEIYTSSLKENGKDFTQKFVALPNHSEHQTGLAIDLGFKKDVIDFIRPDFPYNGICDIFRKKSVQYGFIQRYQKGKEDITKISPEPWHFRYVGYPHSAIIDSNDMSLEEYTDYLKTFCYGKNHLLSKQKDKDIEIFYIPIFDNQNTTFCLPDNAIYKISGNNKDGCIVTLWR